MTIYMIHLSKSPMTIFWILQLFAMSCFALAAFEGIRLLWYTRNDPGLYSHKKKHAKSQVHDDAR